MTGAPPEPDDRPRPSVPLSAPPELDPGALRPAPRTKPRQPPAPWVECATCGWRHFPSMSGGRWRIVTATCASCGAALPERADRPAG